MPRLPVTYFACLPYQAAIQISENYGEKFNLVDETMYTYLPNPTISDISRQGSVARYVLILCWLANSTEQTVEGQLYSIFS